MVSLFARVDDGYRQLPSRHGSSQVNHAITSFNQVDLPASALLGSLESSNSPHLDFLASIWRVAIGTLALSAIALPALQISSTIAYQYSIRRKVHGHKGNLMPILTFRTQQLPVCTAVAQAHVLKALYKHATAHFTDYDLDPRTRHGIATAVKSVMLEHSQSSHLALSERCGAQGLFGYNQIVSLLVRDILPITGASVLFFDGFQSEMRGIAIAEGDILVLSIRKRQIIHSSTQAYTTLGLATELLLGQYTMPASDDPTSVLARHEIRLQEECRQTASSGHHTAEFNSMVLPKCAQMVEAIGHRMAYDAALREGVPRALIDLYVSRAARKDLVWYVEAGLFTRSSIDNIESAALDAILPNLAGWVSEMGAEPYVKAPIVSDDSWDKFTDSLPVFESAVRPSTGHAAQSAVPLVDMPIAEPISHVVDQVA